MTDTRPDILEQVKDVWTRAPRRRKVDRRLSDALRGLLDCEPQYRTVKGCGCGQGCGGARRDCEGAEGGGAWVRSQRLSMPTPTPGLITSGP